MGFNSGFKGLSNADLRMTESKV